MQDIVPFLYGFISFKTNWFINYMHLNTKCSRKLGNSDLNERRWYQITALLTINKRVWLEEVKVLARSLINRFGHEGLDDFKILFFQISRASVL